MRLAVGVGDVGADGDATRVGVLDDCDGRISEVVRCAPRCVGVRVVVVRHLLAVQLLRLSQTCRRSRVFVQRSVLVRVLAVAKNSAAVPGSTDPGREQRTVFVSGDRARHPARNSDVVRRSVLERLRRKHSALTQGESATGNGSQDVGVTSRIDHDGNRRMVLGCSTHHRRAADVDLLDTLVRASARGNRLGEGVQVHDHQFEGRDAEFLELSEVIRLAGIGENAGVDARMQRLHTAFEAFRESGQSLDRRHGDSGVGDLRRGRTGRDQLDTGLVQARGQLDQTTLVVDADKCTAHSLAFTHWGSRPFVHRKPLRA